MKAVDEGGLPIGLTRRLALKMMLIRRRGRH